MLATKVYGPMTEWPNDGGLSARHIRDACDASLRRLQTDHIDLYQMHHVDRDTPWDEIWQAMELLVQQGKVLYVGSSNFAGWHIAQANEAAAKRNFLGLVSEQSLYNLASRTVELEVLPACRAYGLGVIPWSPLAGRNARRREQRPTQAAAKGEPSLTRSMRPASWKWEKFCAELGEEPARRARVVAAAPRGDGADHRPAHARAARRRVAARDRDHARRRRVEGDQRDLPRPRQGPRGLRLVSISTELSHMPEERAADLGRQVQNLSRSAHDFGSRGLRRRRRLHCSIVGKSSSDERGDATTTTVITTGRRPSTTRTNFDLVDVIAVVDDEQYDEHDRSFPRRPPRRHR